MTDTVNRTEQLRADLIEQLQSKGATASFFTELVEDYIMFYELKSKLYEDIKERGVNYVDINNRNKPMLKRNESVKEIVNINKQMLKILKELHLTVTETGSSGDVAIDEWL